MDEDNFVNKEKFNDDRIFIEMPIKGIKDDDFAAYLYSEQILYAMKKGAKFIAIDGEYGTGKSSIINILSSDIANSKKNKKMNQFININFLNINDQFQEENNEEEIKTENTKENRKAKIINKYHRYFVNQVGNSLYKNPYNVEKLFYNNYFSYTTVSMKKNSIYKIIIDKLLLILIGFVSLYLIYSGFFKSIKMFENLYNISTNIMPYIIFLIVILIVLYGYGFYKPEKVEKSPMLDIDKCKNNLCKVLYNTIPKNGNIYFIIDDLDRIDKELQLPIISLLYNEYYHIDSILNNINVKFIFMIDLSKLESDEEKNINPDKLFDYITNISNNQPIILRNYIEKQIQENTILKLVFDKAKNKDYLIGIISKNYSSIRKVKHLFNRIITKYLYLTEKKYTEINHTQLIVISILIGIDNISSLNKKLNEVINNNNLDELKSSEVDLIIKETNLKEMIDNNYYIYLSNFIDVDNLLNPNEQQIYNVCNNIFSDKEEWEQIYDILHKEHIEYSKIYNQIYKYLPNNEKILLLGDPEFYKYVKKNYDIDVNTKDFYKNNFVDIKFENYYNYPNFLNDNSEETLNAFYNEFLNKEQDEEELKKFLKEFKLFINGLKYNIKYYDLKKYFDSIPLNRDIFDLIFSQMENDESILYDLIIENKISWDSIKSLVDLEFIKKLSGISDENKRMLLEDYIINNDFSLENKLYLIKNENNKFKSIKNFLNEANSNEGFVLCYEDLVLLLEKYDYDVLIDKFICKYLKDKQKENDMIKFINSKEYCLSNIVLDNINMLNTKYSFSEFYEAQFKQKEYFELLIYSTASNKNKFSIEFTLYNNSNYLKAVNEVYKKTGKSFSKYEYTDGIKNYIIENFDFSQITFVEDNYWKIDILVPKLLTYIKCLHIFKRLEECGKFNSYISHYKIIKGDNYKFIEFMRMYANEMGLGSGTKSNITKFLKKLRNK